MGIDQSQAGYVAIRLTHFLRSRFCEIYISKHFTNTILLNMMSTATTIKIEPKVQPVIKNSPEIGGIGSGDVEMKQLKVENGLVVPSEESKNDENVLEKQKRTILTMDKKVEIIEYKELHPMETNAYIGRFHH